MLKGLAEVLTACKERCGKVGCVLVQGGFSPDVMAVPGILKRCTVTYQWHSIGVDTSGLGLQDDEPFATSADGGFPPDVVDVLEMLEGGGKLPPEDYDQEPEEGAAFVARMDKLVARFEAQFLKKSQQQVRS